MDSEKDPMAYEDTEREQKICCVLEAAILSKNNFKALNFFMLMIICTKYQMTTTSCTQHTHEDTKNKK